MQKMQTMQSLLEGRGTPRKHPSVHKNTQQITRMVSSDIRFWSLVFFNGNLECKAAPTPYIAKCKHYWKRRLFDLIQNHPWGHFRTIVGITLAPAHGCHVAGSFPCTRMPCHMGVVILNSTHHAWQLFSCNSLKYANDANYAELPREAWGTP